jgi:hypothetical protein
MDVTGKGNINYMEFLEFLCVDDAAAGNRVSGIASVASGRMSGSATTGQQQGMSDDLLESVCASVYFNRVPIRAAARFFDPNGERQWVTPAQFKCAVESVNHIISADGAASEGPMVTESQIKVLVSALCDSEGHINAEAFLNSFKLVDLEEQLI